MASQQLHTPQNYYSSQMMVYAVAVNGTEVYVKSCPRLCCQL